MTPIEIPVATLPMKIVMGCVCPLIFFSVLWWGLPKFLVYLRVVTGQEPRKPGTRTIHMVLGALFYAIIFAPAAIAGAIFLELMTTPPSVISDGGIAGSGGVLSSRKTIAWNEVEKVDCRLKRDHTVKSLIAIAPTKRIDLAGGYDLSAVRDIIWSQVPSQAVRPCYVPLGRNQ